MPEVVSQAEVETIARMAHEVNLAYCNSIGDSSQAHWEVASDWQKNSTIKGVEGILTRVIQNPGDSHRAWLAEKAAEGWTYGEIKDPATKKHPCFVPFQQLPREQQFKDYLFFNVVTAALSAYAIFQTVQEGIASSQGKS